MKHSKYWISIFIFFIFGDGITTYYGVNYTSAVEINPFINYFGLTSNLLVLIFFKFIIFVLIIITYSYFIENKSESNIPLYILLVSIFVTLSNSFFIFMLNINTI